MFSVGAEADAARVSLLLKELEGKDILEVIAAGKEKFASVPSGGGGGVVVSSAGAGGGSAAPAAEEKEEAKKEEEKEESDDVRFVVFNEAHVICILCRWNFNVEGIKYYVGVAYHWYLYLFGHLLSLS